MPDEHRVDIGDKVICHFANFMPSKIDMKMSPVLISINNILGKVKRDNRRLNSEPAKIAAE